MKGFKRLAVLLVIALLLQHFCARADVIVVSASTTQQQIQQKEQEKQELENELDKTEENLEGLREEHSSLQGELNNLNAQLSEVSSNLEELERQIEEKEQNIARAQEALQEAKEKETWQYDLMVTRIRFTYEHNGHDMVSSLLSMGSFADMLNAADYFEKIAAYDQKLMEEYTENRKLIEEEEARLQADRTELENLKTQAEAEKSKVSGLISQTSNTISQYEDDISDAEAAALAYEAEIKQREEDLDYLRKKLQEELAMSQAAANAAWRDISEVTFAEGDRYLLANLIYCEAGGEPYEGQLAVGSVVINRVLSSMYPDTVVGVIYQSRQFSPVASGRLELALASNKATDSCYRAADEAMSGVTNVGNCVYFRTPIEGLSGINIGGHVFY